MRPAFAHRVRVYWEDTDAGGVVYHANYLRFFERSRTEWLRRAGWDQQALRDQLDVVFVVADARLVFRAPARLDDELDITVDVSAPPRATIGLRQQALRSGALLAEGEITLACVGAKTFRPRRIPQSVLQALA
jgi:acyl-CoA thioester hydrolase